MTDVTAMDTPRDAEFGDYFALLKPRVMSLVVFTAAVGIIVAPGGVNPVIALASILFIAIGAGASGALNMWWDADIDRIMKRTKRRPVPAGRVTPEAARLFGLWLSVIAVVMLGLTANIIAAAILAFTIFFYAVVYTMWLKRLTPQNIVIGGAAGAFPPMIGWAVATGGVSVESLLMFGLIFMWTPPHFWALALFMDEDYTAAGVPMLPVTHGHTTTRWHILVYSVLLVPVSLLLAFSAIGGPIYFLIALALNGVFLATVWRLFQRDSDVATGDGFSVERRVFRLSLIYLFAHFVGLLIETILKTAGLSWAAWPIWV